MDYKVISTDNHINEPPDVYVDRFPKHLKDKAPRIVRGADGGDGWSWDGSPPKQTFGLGVVGALTRQNYEQYRQGGIKWEEVPAGNYEGAAQIKENADDGVDAATIYGGVAAGGYNRPDREVAFAAVQAYNDWLIDDFCSADPAKLLSLPLIPVDDEVDVMLREAERVVAKGAAGLYLPLPEVPFHDPRYDGLWQIAVDAQVPVTIHRSTVSKHELMGASYDSTVPGLGVAGVVQRFFSGIGPITNMIFTGVFDRFPDLKFVDAEVNCAWLPALAQQMDQEYERQRHWSNLPFANEPSTYLGKNVFVTILDDFVGCELAKTDPILAATTMFSTDYPHSTTLWPRSQEFIAKMTDGMAAETKHAILAGNAMRAYSLN